MRTIEITLYKFNELDDNAKEVARNSWREGFEFDPEYTIDDFERIARHIGIEFDTTAVPLMGGEFSHKPKIHWSGFYSQGDGACFEGTYRYEKNALEWIREHAPQDQQLHKIVDQLNEIQSRYNGHVEARITHHGRDYHEHSVTIDCSLDDYDLDEEGNEIEKELDQSDANAISELLRDLMRWLYDRLQAEYEYQLSDEVVDENLIANEYEFTKDGRRA